MYFMFFLLFFFFFNDTAPTEIYTLSLPDALPICRPAPRNDWSPPGTRLPASSCARRSEEHTSELQSRLHLVCRLLLEKKKLKDLRHEYIVIRFITSLIRNIQYLY